jgi:hypothetical protein
MKYGNGNGAEMWKPAALSVVYCYCNLRNFKKVFMKFDFNLKVERQNNITDILKNITSTQWITPLQIRIYIKKLIGSWRRTRFWKLHFSYHVKGLLTVFRTHSQTLFVVLKKENKVMSRLIQCIRQLISSIL